MKYINVLLLSLFIIPSLNAMNKPTTCNIFRTFEIKPTESLEIAIADGKLRLVTPQLETSILGQIYSAVASRIGINQQPPSSTIYVLAVMEITKRIELPFMVTQDKNVMRIEELAELDELGISLKELIIHLPSSLPKNSVSIIPDRKLNDLIASREQ